MKICVTGTACVGKSTFIEDFIQRWPMYKKPGVSYREIADELKIKLNKEGDRRGQKLIRDILLEQLEKTKDETHVIYDRGPLDNLVYSIWHNAKKIGNVDDLFIEQSLAKTKKALSNYNIIFFIPLSEKYSIELVNDNQRDTDPIFRQEIDNIFKSIFQSYHDRKDTFFPLEDCPAVIEIFGNREERLQIASMYVNENGNMFGDEDSLLDQEQAKDIERDIKDIIG